MSVSLVKDKVGWMKTNEWGECQHSLLGCVCVRAYWIHKDLGRDVSGRDSFQTLRYKTKLVSQSRGDTTLEVNSPCLTDVSWSITLAATRSQLGYGCYDNIIKWFVNRKTTIWKWYTYTTVLLISLLPIHISFKCSIGNLQVTLFLRIHQKLI